MRPLVIAHLLVFVMLAAAASASLTVTEIMYDPPANESYDEWVEIYNPSSSAISLENFTLCNVSLLKGFINQSDGKTYANSSVELQPLNFAVVTDGGTGTLAYGHYNISGLALHTNASTICSGLSNANGTIALSNGTYSVFVSYNSSAGGSNNNRTLCAYPETNSTLQECAATPGSQNKKLPKFSVNFSSSFIMGTNYTLFNITSDSCVSSEVAFSYNITNLTFLHSENASLNVSCSSATGSFLPSSAGNLTLCWSLAGAYENLSSCSPVSVMPSLFICNISVGIAAPLFANASQSFQYLIELNDSVCSGQDHNVTVGYWIEDLFGVIAKEKANTTQQMTCFKSVSRDWTPPSVSGGTAYIIYANIVNSTCSNATESKASAPLAVKGTQHSQSSIAITSYDAAAKFGDALSVEVDVYRNSTGKYAIDAWTEINGTKSSFVSVVHAKDKNTNYTFRLPVQLKSNCDSALKPGNHTLFVSGLDVSKSVQLKVEGNSSNCKTETIYAGSSASSGSSRQLTEDTIKLEIISYRDSAQAGDELNTEVELTNLFKIQKNVSAYSYIFKGSNLASEGGWMPNAANLTLNASASSRVTLGSRIKDDISDGVYSLRVRAMAGDKNYDRTLEISIAEGSKSETIIRPEENTTKAVVEGLIDSEKKSGKIPTAGMSVTNVISLTSGLFDYILGLHFLSLFGMFSS